MLLLAGAALGACDPGGDNRCGPTSAVVERVIDGDTVELDSGERVRYLMVDTPEVSGGVECYGEEARTFNTQLVEGQEIKLRYDVECEDRFGRLLAYVSVGDRDVNKLLIERGFACVLYIPPNGADVRPEYQALENQAKQEGAGLWACEETPC